MARHHDLEWFLERLDGVEGSGEQFQAWCPCHDDVGTSLKGLSITLNGQRILMMCHSCGAKLPDVLEALQNVDAGERTNGSDESWSPTVRRHSSSGQSSKSSGTNGQQGMQWWVSKTGVSQEIWEGLGCEGHGTGVAFRFEGFDIIKLRRPPKEFRWEPKGVEIPPLWPVPEDELPRHIWINEGESDTGTARAAGWHAYGLTKGAGRGEKKYLTIQSFEALKARGAEEVTLCGDADESGREMLEVMGKAAVDAGLTVNKVRLDLVVDPFAGITDLNGVWKETETISEFKELIQRATQRVSSQYHSLSIEELVELAEKEMHWIMPGLVAPSDKVLISGPQKSYKTWIELDLLRSLVTGAPFLGRAEWTPKETVACLVIQEEGSRQAWAKRVRRLQLPPGAPVHFFHRHGIRFTEPGTVDEVIGFCRENSIQVVFFDPLQRMIPGIDENDSSATGVVWDEVFRLQYAIPGLVVIVVHHANKTERLTWESVRGSSRHAGEVDLGIFCQKHPLEDHVVRIAVDGRDIPQYLGTGEAFEAKVKISHDDDPEHFFTIDATEMQVQVHATPGAVQGKKNRDLVLEAVAQGNDTRAKVIQFTELGESSVREHLKTLVGDGRIKENDQGKGKTKTYSIVEEESTDA